MPVPAPTAAGPVFAILRRAMGVIAVVTADVLFAGTLSGVLAGVAMEAPLVIEPIVDEFTVPVMLSTTVLPTGSCGKVAAILLPEMENPVGHRAPPLALTQVAVMAFKSAGELSKKLALNTSLGPLFRITKLYVMLPPASTVAGPVFWIDKSALALTLAAVLEELLFGLGSVVPGAAAMVAVLMMVPMAVPATVPLTFTVMLEPAGKVAMIALTVLPLTPTVVGQMAPAVALLQLALMPVKVAPLALLGPALLITML
jgi:hypothetical protein